MLPANISSWQPHCWFKGAIFFFFTFFLQCFDYDLGRFTHKTTLLMFWLKISVLVATNSTGDIWTSHQINQRCSPRRSWRCPGFSSQMPEFVATVTAANCPRRAWKYQVVSCSQMLRHSLKLQSVARQLFRLVTQPPCSSPPRYRQSGHKHVIWYIAYETHKCEHISGWQKHLSWQLSSWWSTTWECRLAPSYKLSSPLLKNTWPTLPDPPASLEKE